MTMTWLPVQSENIPQEIKDLARWVVWQAVYRNGPDKKPTKVLYQTNGANAKSNDASTWTTFDKALDAVSQWDGIGLVLTDDDDTVGFDLDKCRHPKTGDIAPWAAEIIEQLDTYAEVSPSGTGIRLLARGTLPSKGRKAGEFECYTTLRFLTFTGHILGHLPKPIENRQDAIDAIHRQMFPKVYPPAPTRNPGPAQPVNLDDAALLAKARAAKNGPDFYRLWRGDKSGYPSHSEADAALASHLRL